MAALLGPQTSHNIGLPNIPLPPIDTQNIQIPAKLRLFSHAESLNPMAPKDPKEDLKWLPTGNPFVFDVDRWTGLQQLEYVHKCVQANAWPLYYGGLCAAVIAASRKVPGSQHEAQLLAEKIEELFGGLKALGEIWNDLHDKAKVLEEKHKNFIDVLRLTAKWDAEAVEATNMHLDPQWLMYKKEDKPVKGDDANV